MSVDQVMVTPIAFPDPPLLNSNGVHEPWALRTIVEVYADGLVGLGETYGDEDHLTLVRTVAPALTGLDPFDLSGLRRRVSAALRAAGVPERGRPVVGLNAHNTLLRVTAAFETALLDLQGQAIGRPVHALLGGKVRDAVPFAAYLFYKWAAHPDREPDEWGEALDAEGIVAQARRMVDRYGFASLKLKGGVYPPQVEIAAIRALREALPGLPLRLDPNCAWSVPVACKVAEETAGLLEYLEDPTPGIDGMAEVAAEAPMPLATNMCVVSFDDVPEAFAKRAVGVVLADHHYWGGLRMTQRLAGICETYGVGVSMHSNSHLGISLAAMVHVGAAMPELAYASDTHTPWQCGIDVVENPLPFVDGSVPAPDSPGLGVRLDRDALARMHAAYLACGIRSRDDTGYMRSIQPDYVRLRPRW
jgi:glucarate dehydratase